MVLKFSVEAKSIVALPLSPQRTRTLNYQFSERDYAIIAKNLFMCRFGSKKVPASAVELWAGQDESEQKQFEILRAHLPAEDFEVFAACISKITSMRRAGFVPCWKRQSMAFKMRPSRRSMHNGKARDEA